MASHYLLEIVLRYLVERLTHASVATLVEV